MNNDQQSNCVYKMGFQEQNPSEIIRKAYGDSAIKKTSVYYWCKKLEECCENVGDDMHGSHPVAKTSSHVTFIEE